MSMTILEDVEKFLIAEIGVDPSKQSLSPDEDLLERGVIDSLGVLRLIAFLEKTYGVEVLDEDIVPENFQNLNTIARFVEHKMQKK
jgi:acyl carrier protein